MVNKDHFVFIDVLRVFAIIGVVSIHATHYFIMGSNYSHGISWWVIALWGTIVRISVPLFFMVSGFLLLNNSSNIVFSKLCKKTFWRLGFPLLFWFILFYLWEFWWLGKSHNISEIVNNFFTTQTGPLYFLQALISLYLLSPLIVSINKHIIIKSKVIITVALFLFAIGFTLLNTFTTTNSFINLINIWSIYLCYFYSGYLLSLIRFKKTYYYWMAIIFITSLVLSILAIANNWLGIAEFYWNYLSINIVVMVLTIYILISHFEMQLKVRIPKIGMAIIKNVSASSYGIYLIHIFAMDIIDRYSNLQIHLVKNSLWIFEIKYISLIFLLSWIITRIILFIPGLRKVIGVK